MTIQPTIGPLVAYDRRPGEVAERLKALAC
jgi:hypothetical protein